ncbi:MAG: TRAP transporter substrate-binding protein [Deltaproteobacteria bacterium]|nr:TRAP transporter substrate-binding protein [Candidatus Anaeroferrophillus wilburensis]MBN2888320.1 TRAP transporter substrate-binding protein [Deltaproteobacteria bacterium]
MQRRKFIKKLGAGVVAAGAALSLRPRKARAAKPKTYNWKMVTTWPPHFPVLGESADNIAKWAEEMSDGRLKITVYGGGELVPPLGVFDAVSSGTVEMGHGAAYYWAGKHPATQFFAAVPFGFNAQSQNAWIYSGGGQELWDEVYGKFNLKGFLAGNTGVQMGGWFNKEINTMDDLKGLKMRIPGLGGKVLAEAGGNAILVAGGEIYTNLDRGVIDATEWVGPYHDNKMGFYKAAKFYYYPGWHEPGTSLDCMVNKQKFEALPKDLQAIIETACYRSNMWSLSEFEAKNNAYLKELVEKHNVQLRKFPEPVLCGLKDISDKILNEIADGDPLTRKVYDHFLAFKKSMVEWNKVSEEQYHQFKSCNIKS